MRCTHLHHAPVHCIYWHHTAQLPAYMLCLPLEEAIACDTVQPKPALGYIAAIYHTLFASCLTCITHCPTPCIHVMPAFGGGKRYIAEHLQFIRDGLDVFADVKIFR